MSQGSDECEDSCWNLGSPAPAQDDSAAAPGSPEPAVPAEAEGWPKDKEGKVELIENMVMVLAAQNTKLVDAKFARSFLVASDAMVLKLALLKSSPELETTDYQQMKALHDEWAELLSTSKLMLGELES